MDIPSVHDHIPLPTSSSSSSPSLTTTTTDSSSQLPVQPAPLHKPDSPQLSSSLESSTLTITDLSQPSLPQAPLSPTFISLDQEIVDFKKTLGGVGASLGGWWGKVQKQSADALAASNITAQLNTARKDLAALNLIEKAKREVERLGEQAKEGYAAVASELEQGPGPGASDGRIVNVDGVELPPPSKVAPEDAEASSPKGKERALNQDQQRPLNQDQDGATSQATASPLLGFDSGSLTSFFTKLSKDSEKLTASLHSTLSQLPAVAPSRLASSAKFDLAEVQKLAEGYLAKGEVYLQDVGKELREIVQEAVKVIPPSEDEDIQPSRPSLSATEPSQSDISHHRRLLETKRESLVSKLRRDEAQILADPTEDDGFKQFLALITDAGGLEGEVWQKRLEEELRSDEPDGVALKAMLDNLVPAKLSLEVFWSRYFFRLHRIDQEEAARRAVLSAAQEDNDGEFSWDMEDESEPASPAVIVKSHSTAGAKADEDRRAQTPTLGKLSSNKTLLTGSEPDGAPTPTADDPNPLKNSGGNNTKTQVSGQGQGHASGRNSSEEGTTDSFDVVSAQQSADENPKNKASETAAAKDDDEDSDWE